VTFLYQNSRDGELKRLFQNLEYEETHNILLLDCQSAALDRHFKRVSDLAVLLFSLLFLTFLLQVLRFAAVAFRKQICRTLLGFSWPATELQSLNWALISERNPF
jgi:hypothetical protein